MNSVSVLRWIVSFSMLISLACSDSVKQLSRTPIAVHPDNMIKALLADSSDIQGTALLSLPSIEMLYSLQGYRPVWTNGITLTQRGDSLLDVLHSVSYYGLFSDDYHIRKIDALIGDLHTPTSVAQKLSELDILMTDALLGMGYHLRHGRIQKDSLFRFERLPLVDTLMINSLNEAINENAITQGIAAQEPAHEGYQILKRELQNTIDSLSIVSDSLSQRLQDKVRQLTINLEQLRWDEDDLPGRYILVNIPSYKLGIVENDSLVFESNVVVGSTSSKTPLLDGLIKSFVVYPAWNVPRKIAAEELLPKIKGDSAYLASNRYRIFDVEGNAIHPDSVKWHTYSANNFPFTLQQSEGDHNALGVIKFVFENPYDVYLHDTNAKRFFEKEYRALSHGCVRVEKAVEMAKFLLLGNPNCSSNDLDRYLAKGGQRQVCLEPIDLRIRYYTCEARSNGSVYFHPDVYGVDKKIGEAIYCRNN